MTRPDPQPDNDDRQDDDRDDDRDQRDDNQDDGDPKPAPDDDEDWTPPGRAEWNRVISTMRARKGELRDLRREMAELRAKQGKTEDQQEPDPRDAEMARLRETAARSAARAALSAAGFSGSKDQAARALRMLDLAAAEPDRNGDFDFDDDIDDLKRDFPGLFEPADQQPGRPRTPRVRTRDTDPDSGNRRDVSDALLRQAGYR